MELRQLLEDAAASERFAMPPLARSAMDAMRGTPAERRYAALVSALEGLPAAYTFQSLLRAAFFIELVKTPKIETTKTEVRWTERLDRSDPRRASFEECFDIFDGVWEALEAALEASENRLLLAQLAQKRLVAYELPLDYKHRDLDRQIHRRDNIVWLWDELPRRVVRLRAFLMDPTHNPYADTFSAAYSQKIQVKTYLTDRVLTGEYKTNREKRWEAHPASVHFALRHSCMEVEHMLVMQLCHFEDFPLDLAVRLTDAGLLVPMESPFRCPITLDPLNFDAFRQAIENPEHGKSDFQVGHLNPLKAVNDDPRTGHTARNISWISADGNRIQGSLTYAETRALLERIERNYAEKGIRPGDPVDRGSDGNP